MIKTDFVKSGRFDFTMYLAIIISIIFVIKYKFKIRELIGVILQLIATIGLFIYYENYKDIAVWLDSLSILMSFIGLMIVISIEDIKKVPSKKLHHWKILK